MLKDRERPRLIFNPGLTGKLIRDGLATLVYLPSPYAKHHRGGKVAAIEHLQLTDRGRKAVDDA